MTTERSFNCILCNNKQFNTKEELQIHFRIHGDPNFSSKKNKLISQELSEDRDDSSAISCDVCPKVFPDPATVLLHKRKIHPESYEKIFCSWCGKFFTMKLLFDRHLLEHDTDIKPGEIVHCDLCDIDFYNIPAMTYHNQFYHRQNYELPEIGYSKKRKRINETLVKILFCPHCGEESINKVNLHKHINDNHEEVSVDSTLRCPLCQAVFYSLDAYEMHLTFHSTSDVYISRKKSFRSKLSEFTLETLPPKIERVDTEDDSTNFDSKVCKGLFLPMEEDQHNEPVVKHVPKKHKKHKKSKKSAITLDEFLNMNTDVFGEGLDFQGIEEVPTQVVAKQLKRKKPNVTTSLNIQKLKALGINVKKKPMKMQTNALSKIQVSNSLGKIKNITDNESNIIKKIPTACNSMLTKLLNQSKDLKIIKKTDGNITKIKEAMDRDHITINNDEICDSDMDVSVAITHLSQNENDIILKKEVNDEIEGIDSVPAVKSEVFESETDDLVCKQEVFTDSENDDDVNCELDDAPDFIKEEIDIEEELLDINKTRQVVKTQMDNNANATNNKLNLINNSDITLKTSKRSFSTCGITKKTNEFHTKSNEIVTQVKVEPVDEFINKNKSDNVSPGSPNENEQRELQNVDTKTKLLLNSQITLKSNTTNKLFNTDTSKTQDGNNSIIKQNLLEFTKLNKKDVSMHKLHNDILSNRQITIKPPQNKLKLSDVNKDNTPEIESCEESDENEEKCENLDDINVDINKDKKQEKNIIELQTSAMNPKKNILLNSQITVKSSNSNSNQSDKNELESFDDNTDTVANSDSDASELHLLKKINKTEIEKNRNNRQLETLTMSPKNKLLLNTQITIKSTNIIQKHDEIKGTDYLNDEADKDDDSNSDSSQLNSLTKQKETTVGKNINQINTATMDPKNKLLYNSNITVKLSPNSKLEKSSKDSDQNNLKREISGELVKAQKNQSSDSDSDDYHKIKNLNIMKNKITVKPSTSLKNPVVNDDLDSDNEEFDSLDNTYKQQRGFTMNKVNTLKEESSFMNTSKILSNSQLTIKQISTKSTANKVYTSNDSQQKITMTSSVQKIENNSVAFSNQKTNVSKKQSSVQSNSLQSVVKINESSRDSSINSLKNYKGIKIKQYKQSSSSDDEVEYVGGSSDEEMFDSPKTMAQNTNTVKALSNVQNKLGVGITIKNINNLEEDNQDSEDNQENESDDELKEPVEIGSIIKKENSIVNKLKTNNLGLSIKTLKQNSNDSFTDSNQSETSASPRDDLRPFKTSLEKNTNNNKHLMIKPSKAIKQVNRDIKSKSSVQIKNANQNVTNDNEDEVVKQETTSTSNGGETVTQAVTVKQFKTETVIEEITTTVTKTIRTVSQAVNEEHATTSTQKSLNANQPSPTFVARPVKISNQIQKLVTPTNIGRIRQAAPRVLRAPRPVNSVTPMSCSQPRPIVFRAPNPRGPRPLKIANSPNRMIRPSVSPQCSYKTVKIAPNVKTAPVQKPIQRVSSAADKTAVHHVSTAQSFKASQIISKNVSGAKTTKVVERSVMASSQMKSECSSSGTSQQVSKVSMSSVNAKTVKKFESNVSKSNSTSLIEKLQQLGLLIKKPRLEVDFSDHSDEEETIDYDND